ncbi:hypothetical protein K461DRAFT_266295 [Myriangium duriaei CBS 260.36]|uniref:DUF788 domain-containing protein n=1 Tax=Myriangium duriaei CBS 260.36 TaxID=1168546 RepID=A0A9P4J5H6_9PEZI|nr:hypothetical protein K461DRAFT_266295 [Myriangium duriaei CBS 260.36]
MAQKAGKNLAAKNTATLNKLHITSLIVHLFFLLWTFLIASRSRLAWFLISLPGLLIEAYFEIGSRPFYHDSNDLSTLRKSGQDLEAKGMTEWMWDVVYWTWGCVVVAAVAGNWAWYLYAAVPLYTVWTVWTTFNGARAGLSGLAGGSGEGAATAPQSKRAAKAEKRGNQKFTYR